MPEERRFSATGRSTPHSPSLIVSSTMKSAPRAFNSVSQATASSTAAAASTLLIESLRLVDALPGTLAALEDGRITR